MYFRRFHGVPVDAKSVSARSGQLRYCLPIACRRGGVARWVGVYQEPSRAANETSFHDVLHYVFFMLPSCYICPCSALICAYYILRAALYCEKETVLHKGAFTPTPQRYAASVKLILVYL